MDGLFGQSDGLIRFAVFLGVFLTMALIEFGWPKRSLIVSKRRRWLTNIGISAVGTAVLRLMAMLAVPIAAVAAAFYAERHGIGLLNQVAWPEWLKVAIALVALDLAIWVQHWASHKVPILWRLHRVHHADRDIDVTTAVRFHPVEIALSMLWKIVVVIPLGASPLAVFLFEVILNACAMFNHANIAVPAWLDRVVRVFIVTPDMHRVHHSAPRMSAAAPSRARSRVLSSPALAGLSQTRARTTSGQQNLECDVRPRMRRPSDEAPLPPCLAIRSECVNKGSASGFRGKVVFFQLLQHAWQHLR